MQIAIIGGGLAGVATAWNLLNFRQLPIQITLFDQQGIASGASGIAAGLVSSFGGARATLLTQGMEGIAATLELVKIAEQVLNISLLRPGILRLALTDQQQQEFYARTQKFPDQLHWWPPDQCQSNLPQLAQAPGLWIPQAYQIDTRGYLNGLWQACEQLGAELICQRVEHWKELDSFDYVIATMGADSLAFPELHKLPAKRNKGQIVGFSTLPGLTQLPFALNSHAYLVSALNSSLFWAGATYEHDEPLDTVPHLSYAWELLRSRLEPMLPLLKEAVPQECLAGWRLSTRDYRPLIQRLDQRRWILTGFGSKGLLYHALYARQLVKRLMDEIGLLS